MPSKFVVEKDFLTEAGLRAVIIYTHNHHRCGYVGVSPEHPAYGKGYSTQLDCITQEEVTNVELGKKSSLLLLTAALGSDEEYKKIRRSIDILIDVHGGVTYSGGNNDYPVKADNIWWFGFDCSHDGDDAVGGQSLEYCIAECESMAQQLSQLHERNRNDLYHH